MEKANTSYQHNHSYSFLWLAIGLLPLLLIALLLPVTPQDYWWYLRLGQDILKAGHVPTVETYSFTYAGQPTVNHPWLSAVILWIVYLYGGLNLTFLLRAICIGAAYGMLWVWERQCGAGPRLASILMVIAGLAGSSNWSIRPQMFAYPLFVLTLWLLWKWHKGDNKVIWTLPVISLFWANLHDSFVLVFLLGVAALIFGQGERKALLLSLITSFIVTLINPQGINLWISNFESAISPASRNLSVEWLPPTNLGWQMNIFFAWIVALAPLASFSTRRLSTLEWVWFIGLTWMSLSGIRYVVWGLLLLAAISAYLLSDWDGLWLDKPPATIHPKFNFIFAILLLLISLVALPWSRNRLDIKSAPLVSPDTPITATQWLSEHPELPGPLWSDLSFSSYLIFALPSRPIWVDTRFERTYPVEQYERYIEIASAAPDWQEVLDQENINLLMISASGEPRLSEVLHNSNNWCKQYGDQTALIFSRRMPGETCP